MALTRNIVGFILSVAFFIIMLSEIVLTVAVLNVMASMARAYFLSYQLSHFKFLKDFPCF